MKINCVRSCVLAAILIGCSCEVAMAQVVRVAPIVRLIPTPDADSRYPGTVPPASEPLVEVGATAAAETAAAPTTRSRRRGDLGGKSQTDDNKCGHTGEMHFETLAMTCRNDRTSFAEGT